MARPVRKRLLRGILTGLRQRIRSRGRAPAKMESAHPDPHKRHGVEGHLLRQGLRVPDQPSGHLTFTARRLHRPPGRAARATGSARRPDTPPGMVRRPARPGRRPPRLHRRNLGLDQHGAPPWALPARRTPAGRRAPRALEDHDLRRRPHHPLDDRALGARRADQPRRLRDLGRPGPRSDADARRRCDHGQPVEPQGPAGSRDDRGCRGRAALPAAPDQVRGRLYSPDFNPIENALARLKALPRKAAERTVDRLWAAIGRIVDLFTPAECRNYFANAGYDAT